MKRLLILLLMAGCAAPPPAPVVTRDPFAADTHLPPYVKRPPEGFTRQTAVAVAQREWRAFGSVIDDSPPGRVPMANRPDRQPGLWQRVADYWWFGQDFNEPAGGWGSKYNELGSPYGGDAPAWSAAFISYVMRTSGAGNRFVYSPLHADYINAAARQEAGLRAERPELYAPRPGDLICLGRGAARRMTFDDLPANRFFAHCDLVTGVSPGQIEVIGGNVFSGVTLKHVPTTPQGTLAGPDGRSLDSRFEWFVVLQVGYDS